MRFNVSTPISCRDKNFFTSQNSMYKEQKNVIFPSGIFIFARILHFFFLYLKIRFQREYLRILLLIGSGDIETNPGPKKQSCLRFFSLEFKWTGRS